MQYQLSYLNKVHDVGVRQEKDEFIVTIGQKVFRLKDCAVQGYQVSCRIEDKPCRMYFAQDKDNYYLAINGEYYVMQQASARKHSFKGSAASEANIITSPMPGLLVKMPVTAGKEVKAGDTLAIVEAMKMQNELRAPRDGVVKKVNFKEGDQVDAFQTIVEIEPLEPQ
ncbi:MAG: biotin/lipoyl-containing protein [bacterium]